MQIKIGKNETDEEAESRIAKRIYDYSFPGVSEISCDKIDQIKNDKVVWLGDTEMLMESAERFLDLGWMDKWRGLGAKQDDISYHIVEYGEAESCRKKYKLKINQSYLAYISPN